jgi:hypothetical protein
VKRGGSLSFLTIFTFVIKSNNSGTTKVKIVKNEREPPLFTSKLLIKFQNILRNTSQVIIRRFGYGNRLDRCGEWGYILVSCAHSNTSLQVWWALLCINCFTYLPESQIWKKKNLFIKTFFHNFCLFESSFTSGKWVSVKNERDPPLFTGKLLINFKTFCETLLKLSYDIA